MKLRTLIFVILLALGVLPILTLVGVNLRDHINKHETVEEARITASVESSFVTLNAHVENLKKSLLQVSSTPLTVSQASGHSMSLMSQENHVRLGELLIHLLNPEKVVAEVHVIDLNGKEKVRLFRNGRKLLQAAPDSALQNFQDSPLFWKGLQLQQFEIDSLFQGKGAIPDPAVNFLNLISPIIGSKGTPIGVVLLAVDLRAFLSPHLNACWATTEGDIVHMPATLSLQDAETMAYFRDTSVGGNIFASFPALKGQTRNRRPFVWESGHGRSVTWLPLIFNTNQSPALWIGTPVDRSAAEEWKLSLIYNIVWIVLIMSIIISLIANAIAQKIDQIKESILTGLDRILNRGEEDVHFAWTGPSEVVNLAEELTTLARRYSLTRQKQGEAEAALRESEDKFRNLTASAQDAIALMDHRGNISYWNEAAAEIFGYTAEEAMGKPIHSLISPRLSESSQRDSAEERPMSDGPIRETIELVTRRKDGSEVPIELSLSEARIKDQWNSIWIIRDITDRKRAEDETRLQQQQLIQADKMISLGVLISGVAHEINNPNSIAMLNTAMLNKAWESARPILDEYYRENGDFLIAGLEYSEMCEQIPRLFLELEDSARRIKNIVQDLKDYARQDTSRLMEQVDLNEVAQAAVRLNHNKISKSTKHFHTDLAATLPPIRGNRQRLEQVLINLIQNSCEALTGPEQAITIASRHDPDKKEVRISVHDQGAGIPPEILHQIMDPFFTTKRSYGGTGLGLSVSAGIVKEHNGRLSFTSSPEEGTMATVTFPLPAADDDPDAAPPEQDNPSV
ncbi:two-component system sensor histidine kinase NtrB [Thiovibrio sp. JS02]